MANPAVTYARSGKAEAQDEFNGLAVANGGAIDTSCNVDFAKASLFKCTMNNVTVALTPTNLPLGKSVKLHIRAGATAPTVTWGTMSPAINWVGASAPTFTNSKMTMVTLTNDGTETVGSFVVES